MLSGIVGVVLGLVAIIAAVLALLSEELNANKKLKYVIVGSLLVLVIYAMIGSLLAFVNAGGPTTQASEPPVAIAVDATRDWQSTGVVVNKGDTVRVRVVGGSWTAARARLPGEVLIPDDLKGREIWVYYSPDQSGEGCPTCTCADYELNDCPVPTANIGTLVARIDASEPFAVGNDKTFTAPIDGRLHLRINDGHSEGTASLQDNAGVLAVEIIIER